MKNQKQDQHRILDETIEFYKSKRNRATTKYGACKYIIPAKDKRCKERKCAIGRLMTDDQLKHVMDDQAGGAYDAFTKLHKAEAQTRNKTKQDPIPQGPQGHIPKSKETKGWLRQKSVPFKAEV